MLWFHNPPFMAGYDCEQKVEAPVKKAGDWKAPAVPSDGGGVATGAISVAPASGVLVTPNGAVPLSIAGAVFFDRAATASFPTAATFRPRAAATFLSLVAATLSRSRVAAAASLSSCLISLHMR
jgi:hypothetical protein